jgi:general secretion pathway protein I
MHRRGFTLLEVLVATTIMGIAVVTLLSSISTSLRNASRLTDHERAATLARQKMNELLLDKELPKFTVIEGRFDPAVTGIQNAGWSARLTPFDVHPGSHPGVEALNRLELAVWWTSGDRKQVLSLEGFQTGVLTPADMGAQ